MKTIIILGMHRSATSMVARSLHKSNEVHMGQDLILNLSDNPEGHYENKKFVKLNDEILRAAGGTWDNPPSHESIMKQASNFSGKIKTIIAEESEKARKLGHKSWGWKDPRTVLTIELYMPYLDKPQFISCLRNPEEIAKSLQKRNKFTLEKGISLTKDYNNRLLEFLNKNR